MIINGNYKWLDYEKMKPKVIETFVKLHGEDFREHITDAVSQIVYIPFHKFDYVNFYYKKFIMKYKDQILDNFFEISGYENTQENREALIYKDCDYFDQAPLNFIIGAESIDRIYDAVKSNINTDVYARQRILFENFGLNIDNKHEFQENLAYIVDCYIKAVKKVEKDNPCDLYQDMATIENNINNGIISYINFAVNNGYKLSERDKNIINSYLENPEENSLYEKLNRMGFDLFSHDINFAGTITYFDTEYENIMRKSKSQDRYSILYNRLQYLHNQGVEFELFDIDEFKSYNPNNATKEINDKIEKEYKIQTIKNPNVFIDQKTADLIEIKRREICSKQYENCKFNEQFDKYKHRSADYSGFVNIASGCMDSNFMDTIFNRTHFMFINEENNGDKTYLLNTLLHETSHDISKVFQIQNCYIGLDKRDGLDLKAFSMNYGKFNGYISYAENKLLSESYNQKISDKATDIYMENYDIDEDIFVSDINEEDKEFTCTYDYLNFLTNDFCTLFDNQLQRNLVDPDFEMFFDFNIYNSKIGKLQSRIKSLIQRLFDKETYYSQGYVDYHKVVKLNELITKAYTELLVVAVDNEIDPDQLVSGECVSSMDFDTYKKYIKFKKQKDKIISSMLRDVKTLEKRYLNSTDFIKNNIEFDNTIIDEELEKNM